MSGPPSLVPGRAREEFLAEAQELVAEAGRELSALEDLQRRGARDPDRVHALFRHVHTLKGLAGTFGVADVARLAHALEDLLDALRFDRLPHDDDALADVARCLAQLDLLVERARAGLPDDAATDRVIQSLQRPELTAAAPVALDPSLVGVLTEYEEHRLRQCLADGARLWRVATTAPLDQLDRALEALRAAARPFGEVITFTPGGLDPTGTALELGALLASREEGGALRAALAVDGRTLEAVPMAAPTPAPVGPPAALATSLPAPPRALRSVRVDIARLDELLSLAGDFALLEGSLARAIGRARGGDVRAAHGDLARIQRDLRRGVAALQRGLLEARMVPLGQVFERVASEARKLSRRLARPVRVVVTGADTAVDKLIVEELGAPLLHLVRNAIDHGIEPEARRVAAAKPAEGTLAINAWQAGSRVVVEVEDDGAGVDLDDVRARAVALGLVTAAAARTLDARATTELLFRPGFTTRDDVTDTSGRGVGLDVVRASLARIGAAVELSTERAVSTRVTITLPITLAILPVLLLTVAGRRYVAPMTTVTEALRLRAVDVHRLDGRPVVTVGGRTLPLCRLDALFGHDEAIDRDGYAVVIALGGRRAAFAVDAVRGQRDVVVKPLGRSLRRARWFAGATDLGDHRPALLLDAIALLDEAFGLGEPPR